MGLENTDSLRRKLVSLRRIIDKSRGKEIVRLQAKLMISHQMLKENYRDLIAANEQYLTDHSIEQPGNSQKLNQFLLNFQRLLFNYLATFIFFMNHSEIIVEGMGNAQLIEEFDVIKTEKKLIEKIEFAKDLQNYLHYHRLPFPRIETNYLPTPKGLVTDTNPFFCKGEVGLRKSELLKWNGFQQVSKDFLRGYFGNVIVIVSSAKFGCVDDCQAATKEVFGWLKTKVAELFETEIADFTELKKRYEESLRHYNEKWKGNYSGQKQ